MRKKKGRPTYFFLKHLQFKNLSILYKIYFGFFVLFLMIFVLALITFTAIKNDKQLQTLDVISQMNRKTVSDIDETIRSLTQTSKFPLFRENGYYNHIFLTLENSNETNLFDYRFKKGIEQEAYRYLLNNEHLHSIYLFNRNGNGDFYMDSRGTMIPEKVDPLESDWFKQSLADFQSPVVISSFLIKNLYNNKPVHLFGVSRGIYKLETSQTIGVILVNAKLDYLLELLGNMKIVPNQKVLIVDKQNKIVADEDLTLISQDIDPLIRNYLDQTQTESLQNISINGVDYLFSTRTSKVSGWKIINMIPATELYKNINSLAWKMLLLALGMMTIMLIVGVLFANAILKPVKKLVLLMRLAERGHFDKVINLDQEDEIGQLAKTFNRMSRRIKKLINKVYVDKITQKELELQMLKNQINPHFLYNTLESIRMVAVKHRNEDVAEMAYSLGKILQYGISLNRDLVKVQEEVDHLHQYIALQKIRFEHAFTIIVDIDIRMLDQKMLKMIFQPLVENAIYHGLAHTVKDGRIMVRGHQTDDHLVFEIEDNGQGIEAVKLLALNQSFRNINELPKSIGLYNVNKRIQLYYGERYGIEITSEVKKWTKITVKLPKL